MLIRSAFSVARDWIGWMASPASFTKVSVKPTKVVAKGSNFGTTVQVFVDGIPFAQAATVKGGKKVTQKGALLTGQSVRDYIAAHGGSARISFRSANGAIAAATVR